MRVVRAYSKQYSVKEQRRFMYIKNLLVDAGGPGIFKAIFSDRMLVNSLLRREMRP